MSKAKTVTFLAKVGNEYNIITNVIVSKSTGKVGTANFRCINKIEKGTYIEITTKAHQSNDSKIVFFGYVTKSTGSNSQYEHACEDVSSILKGIKLLSTTSSGFIAPIIIRPKLSNGRQLTINEIVRILTTKEEIITDCYGLNKSDQLINVHDSGGIGSSTKIPGTETDIPNMQFSHMSVGAALTKFLVDTLHLNVWYEFTKDGKVDITYGKYRKPINLDIRNEYIMSNSLYDSVDYPRTDGLYLINDGKDENYKEVHVGDITSKYVVTYRTTHPFNEKEMLEHATQIMNDRKITRKKYKVTFPPGEGLHFKPGDYFNGLGDSTLGAANMEYKKDNGTDEKDVWQIFTIEFSNNATIVYVGDTYKTIFDKYKDTLREIDGIYTATNNEDATFNAKLTSDENTEDTGEEGEE